MQEEPTELNAKEKRAIAALESEARVFQQMAGIYEKLAFLSMSSIAGAIAVASTLLARLGATAPLGYLIHSVLAFMGVALVALYSMMDKSLKAASRFDWISYINDPTGKVPYSWETPRGQFVVSAIKQKMATEPPTAVMNMFLKRHVVFVIILIGFFYATEQFINFGFYCLLMMNGVPTGK